MTIYLGSFYWSERIGIKDILANDFDFPKTYKKKGINIKDRRTVCKCGNYGERITFNYQNKEYEFIYLTGYPCRCRV